MVCLSWVAGGWAYSTLICEGVRYLPWLTARFQRVRHSDTAWLPNLRSARAWMSAGERLAAPQAASARIAEILLESSPSGGCGQASDRKFLDGTGRRAAGGDGPRVAERLGRRAAERSRQQLAATAPGLRPASQLHRAARRHAALRRRQRVPHPRAGAALVCETCANALRASI